MTLFILLSNNERIPFHKLNKTPLALKSAQKLKENLQERKYRIKANRTKQEGSMKERQFGSLDIVITRRKLQEGLHLPVTTKRRKGCHGTFVEKQSFPENLDVSFHQGLLGNSESGSENITSDQPDIWKRRVACQSLQSSKAPRTVLLPPKSTLCSSQKVFSKSGNDLPLSLEFPKLKLVKEIKSTKDCPTTVSESGTMKTVIPKAAHHSCHDGHLPNPLQEFKIPETPFIPKPPFIPGTPQCKARLHQNGKNNCTTVPETPLLNVSSHSMPAKDDFKRKSTHCCSPEGKDTRQGWWKGVAKRQCVQVVPETPYLKLSDELSLYDQNFTKLLIG